MHINWCGFLKRPDCGHLLFLKEMTHWKFEGFKRQQRAGHWNRRWAHDTSQSEYLVANFQLGHETLRGKVMHARGFSQTHSSSFLIASIPCGSSIIAWDFAQDVSSKWYRNPKRTPQVRSKCLTPQTTWHPALTNTRQQRLLRGGKSKGNPAAQPARSWVGKTFLFEISLQLGHRHLKRSLKATLDRIQQKHAKACKHL